MLYKKIDLCDYKKAMKSESDWLKGFENLSLTG